MLTLRGTFKDGKIEFLDEVPFTGQCDVLVTFLDEMVMMPSEKRDLLVRQVRESGFGLSPRELEVLKLAQQGMLNREIAEALEISAGTVRNYLSSVYSKLEVRNKTEAIKRTVEVGLLAPFDGF